MTNGCLFLFVLTLSDHRNANLINLKAEQEKHTRSMIR